MYTFYFEKLEVWQNARLLVKAIYEISGAFPDSESFGLTNQLRRAALSITANIAEGCSRHGNKDKARFINQAYSSAWEVMNFIILAFDLKFLTGHQYEDLRNQAEKITNQLNALHKAILRDFAVAKNDPAT